AVLGRDSVTDSNERGRGHVLPARCLALLRECKSRHQAPLVLGKVVAEAEDREVAVTGAPADRPHPRGLPLRPLDALALPLPPEVVEHLAVPVGRAEPAQLVAKRLQIPLRGRAVGVLVVLAEQRQDVVDALALGSAGLHLPRRDLALALAEHRQRLVVVLGSGGLLALVLLAGHVVAHPPAGEQLAGEAASPLEEASHSRLTSPSLHRLAP